MPVAAGNRAASGDVQLIQAASSQKGLVRLVQQTPQTINSNVDTALLFGAGSEEIDTAAWHDVATNTSRITPLLAGYVQFTATVWWVADTDDIAIWAGIGKNNVIIQRSAIILPSTATASTIRSVSTSCIQQCNGTTDYFELFAKQLQATPGTLSSSTSVGTSSTFEAQYLRGL